MRKTSQDGGDSTSITSGIENEIKKPAIGLAKIKRNSIKKKVPSFSHESDDGVGEPLLQKDVEKSEYQSAKYVLSKSKTDSAKEKMDDKDMLLPDHVTEKTPFSSFSSITGNGTRDDYKPYVCTSNVLHNHMNANVFNTPDGIKSSMVPKTQVLVEIDGNKHSNYSSSPLIFTTAKIHADGKQKNMEPVQVTPVPILSTVEGSIIKTSSLSESERNNIEKSLGKSNIKLSSNEVPKLTSIVAVPLKVGPTSSDGCKIMLDGVKNQNLSNKISLPSSTVHTTLSNVITSSLLIGNTQSLTNMIVKEMDSTVKPITSTSDKVPQTLKQIPKSSDGKNITVTRELDLNKNFHTDPSQSAMKMSETTSTQDKINKLITSGNKATDKHVSPITVTTSIKGKISNTAPTKGQIQSVSSIVTPTTSNKTAFNNIPIKISTATEPIKCTSALTFSTTCTVKPSSITSNAMPKITSSLNKEVSKDQNQTQPISVESSAIPSTALNLPIKPTLSTVLNSVTSVDLLSGSKPTVVTASSIVNPTNVKIKPTSSTTLTDTKTTTGKQPIKSDTSTINTVVTLPKKATASTCKTASTPSSVPTTAISNIKSPNSMVKNIIPTIEKSEISCNKTRTTANSTTITTTVAAKPSTQTTNSDNIPTGKPSISKPVSTPSTRTLDNTSVKLNTSSSIGTKNISSSAISTGTIPSKIPTTNIASKVSQTKDTADNKIANFVLPTSKSTPAAVSKSPQAITSQTLISSTKDAKTLEKSATVPPKSTPATVSKSPQAISSQTQISSTKDTRSLENSATVPPKSTPAAVSKSPQGTSSQTLISSTKDAKTLENSATALTKSSSNSGSGKPTTANLTKTRSGQMKENPRPTASTSTVTSSQVSKTPVVSKSKELQTTEHKKEKFK